MNDNKIMCTDTDYVGGAFKMHGNWEFQSELLKKKFAQLTDYDLEFSDGQEKQLLRRLEIKLNKKREEIIEIIKSFQPAKRTFSYLRSRETEKL